MALSPEAQKLADLMVENLKEYQAGDAKKQLEEEFEHQLMAKPMDLTPPKPEGEAPGDDEPWEPPS